MDIVSFIHEMTWDCLSPRVRRQAVRCLLDSLGASIGGRATELSRIIHDFAAAAFGGRGARLWQDGREVSPPGAALANGMTIDALDIHDGHSLTKGHAGAAIVPATLAMLASGGQPVSGQECLMLIAIGYEVAIRAGIALHASASDYHSSGSWNALGAAAVVARRLKLNQEQTLHALGVAEYHGPRSQMMRCIDDPTMVKDGSGWGAMAGVSAALLAAAGFTGAPAVTADASALGKQWNDLGERWEILSQYFKPHAVCRWAQPAVEGAVLLQRRHDLRHDEITAIHIDTFHEATRLTNRAPTSTEEAQYSLSFPVAAVLVHGEMGAAALMGAALSDPRVLRLAASVKVVQSREFDREFPARRLANVTIETTDGRRLEVHRVEPRWDGASPPADEELIAKFRGLTASLPLDQSQSIEKTVLNLAELPDARVLADLMATPCG